MADSPSDPPAEPLKEKIAAPSREASQPAPPEERELWSGRGSAKFFAGRWAALLAISILLLIGGFALGGAIDANWPILAGLGLAAVGVASMLGKVGHFVLIRRYRLTNQRLFIDEGILVATKSQCDLIRVNDVSVTKTLTGRLLDVGTVTVDCPSDTSSPKILILGVTGPDQIAEHIHREMRAIRDRKSLVMEAT